jgi:GNAT superfamily N-acetyltransferase
MRAALQWSVQEVADEVREYGIGWGARTHDLRHLWTLNQLCVTRPASFDEIVEAAEELQGDLPFRHVNVHNDSADWGPARGFTDAGWRYDREVLMLLTGDADRRVDTSAAVELSQEQMGALMRRWNGEEAPDRLEPEEAGQIAEYHLREGRLWNETIFGVLGPDGTPVSLTKARSHDSIGWVEDVYTITEARGQGNARMLVTHVTDLLRSRELDPIFIIADDNDWPKNLYARIGFEPVAFVHTLHLDLGGITAPPR